MCNQAGCEAMAEGQTSSNQKDPTPNPHCLCLTSQGWSGFAGFSPRRNQSGSRYLNCFQSQGSLCESPAELTFIAGYGCSTGGGCRSSQSLPCLRIKGFPGRPPSSDPQPCRGEPAPAPAQPLCATPGTRGAGWLSGPAGLSVGTCRAVSLAFISRWCSEAGQRSGSSSLCHATQPPCSASRRQERTGAGEGRTPHPADHGRREKLV